MYLPLCKPKINEMRELNFDFSNERKVIYNDCCGPVELSVIDNDYYNLMRLERMVNDWSRQNTNVWFARHVSVKGKFTETHTPMVTFENYPKHLWCNFDDSAAQQFKRYLKNNDSEDLVQYVFSGIDKK